MVSERGRPADRLLIDWGTFRVNNVRLSALISQFLSLPGLTRVYLRVLTFRQQDRKPLLIDWETFRLNNVRLSAPLPQFLALLC